MLNAFLSLWHVDVLVWCELGLLGIITVGTVFTAARSKPSRKHLILGAMSVLAVAATVFADNLIVLTVAYIVLLGCAVFLVKQTFPAMSAKHKKILIVLSSLALLGFVANSVLNVLAGMHAGLWWQEAVSMQRLLENAASASAQGDLRRYGLLFAGIGFVCSLPIFLAKTRASSFFATIVPAALFIVLLRFTQVVDATLNDGGELTRRCFWIAGLVILAVVVLKLYRKKQHASALQLSGVVQLGLVAFMIGAGPAGIIPAILHIFGQAVIHAGLWTVVQHAEMKRHNGVRFLTVALFAALLAVPGSVLFVSTLIGVGYALQEHLWFALAVYVALVAIAVRLVRAKLSMMDVAHPETSEPLNSRSVKFVLGVLALYVIAAFGAGGYLLTQQGIQFAVSVAQSVATL